MTLTTVPTVATGDVYTAAMYNTYLKDNMNDLIAFANGTSPFVGSQQKFANDSSLYFGFAAAGRPLLNWDASDYLEYTRSTNTYVFNGGGNLLLNIASDGKLTGKGFYSGGETTITNTSTATFAHGLGAIPRFFQVRYSAGSGGTKSSVGLSSSIVGAASEVRISSVDATNITVANNSGSTQYCVVDAIL